MSDSTTMQLPVMLEVWQQTLNWQPDETQQAKFQQVYDTILSANQQLNLTRITTPDEFWEKHLWDSLRGLHYLWSQSCPDTAQVIDIGTGGGFPGIPVAIAHPTWTVTLLDSTRKKTAFLETLLQTLDIQGGKTVCDRAEQVGQQPHHRDQYDLALIRAVASAPVCAEYAVPLLKLGGMAVLYRGQWTDEEAESLPGVVKKLGGTVEFTDSFITPLTQSARHCIYVRKTAPTPLQFPRAVGVPVHKPLTGA